jgi:hypothetical protein
MFGIKFQFYWFVITSVIVFLAWSYARTGARDHLVYVSPVVTETGGATANSLCQLQRRWAIGPFDYQAKSVAYALSKTNCQGPDFTTLTEESFVSYQAKGLVPAGLPSRPALSASEAAMPYIWYGLFFAGLLGAVVFQVREWRHKRHNRASPDFVAALTGVMCHAFALSNRPPGAAAESIAGMVRQFARSSINVDRLHAHLKSGDVFLSSSDIARLGHGLSDYQREQVMRATLVMSGNSVEAQDFAAQVQRALRISDEQRQFAAENSLVMR